MSEETIESKEIEVPQDNGEEETPIQKGDEEAELEHLKNQVNTGYLKVPKAGATEALEVTAESYREVPAKKLPNGDTIELKTKDKGLGYYYALFDDEGRELSVAAWALHNELKKVFVEGGKISGVKLKITHPGRGEYKVEVITE